MAINTAAILIPFMLLGLCYSCPIPGACNNLPDIATYGSTIAHNPPNLNTTVGISHTNVQFSFAALRNDLINPQPTVLQDNCTGNAGRHFSAYNTSRCPWYYVCDYNPQRIPPFIYHAKCNTTEPANTDDRRVCTEVYSLFFYLTTESCVPLASSETQWTGQSTYIPVACTDVYVN